MIATSNDNAENIKIYAPGQEPQSHIHGSKFISQHIHTVFSTRLDNKSHANLEKLEVPILRFSSNHISDSDL